MEPEPMEPHPTLRLWPALLLTPLLALGHLSLAYALVTPSCARQDSGSLHTLSAVSLVLAVGMTVLAWRTWAAMAAPGDGVSNVTESDGTLAASRPRFLGLVSTLVGALASLVILTLWLPVWLLPPCS
jgi:hypothetical protein